jgi:hypothetical protein
MSSAPESSSALATDTTTVKPYVAPENRAFLYEYDFGDSWEHEIVVEKVLPAVEGIRYPICIAGKRACPPEDCGGVGGYERMLDIIANPKHEEHAEMLEWLGGSFDPEAFDLGNSQGARVLA